MFLEACSVLGIVLKAPINKMIQTHFIDLRAALVGETILYKIAAALFKYLRTLL